MTWSQASRWLRWTEWPRCAPCCWAPPACSSSWHSSPGWGSACAPALSWLEDQLALLDHPDHPGRRMPGLFSAVDSCTDLQESHTRHSVQTCSCKGRGGWLPVVGGGLARTGTPCDCVSPQWTGWGTAWLCNCYGGTQSWVCILILILTSAFLLHLLV